MLGVTGVGLFAQVFCRLIVTRSTGSQKPRQRAVAVNRRTSLLATPTMAKRLGWRIGLLQRVVRLYVMYMLFRYFYVAGAGIAKLCKPGGSPH